MATAQRAERQLFDVPPELMERGGAWPPSPELQGLYQLPTSQVNIGEMLAHISTTLPRRIEDARRRGLESPGWGNLLSVRDFPDPTSLFEPITGALRLPDIQALPLNSPLRSFYEKSGRTHLADDGTIENRGARYYAIADHELATPQSKLAVMREDIQDALAVVQAVDRSHLSETEYLLYLGALDVLKQNALALYHAFTFPERAGNHQSSAEYEQHKQATWDFAKSATRKYYQTLLGRNYDNDEAFSLDAVDDAMQAFLKSDPHVAQFKLQEIDHPLLIALSAHEAALTNPDVDTIVAMPSGGTQIGIVTQLMYEIHPDLAAKRWQEPALITVPLSTHSGRMALSNEGFSLDGLVKYIRARYSVHVQGKSVLVTEDNGNRGKTAEMIYTALMAMGAQEVHISLAELDPHRVIFKQQLPKDKRPTDVLNMAHPDFRTAIGIVPMQVVGDQDQQTRKLRAREVIGAARTRRGI